MKNTVSFETAKRIFETGFPQPETVQEGQFWYSCIVRKTRERELRYINQFDRTGILPTEFFACYPYFAPTATDILAQLPSNANISKPFNAELWLCVYGENEDDWTESDNPAEAAALAWLEIHEKKAFTPNVRITFEQNQTIECYDFEGNQRLLEIQKDKQYDAVLNDGWATIESVFGPVKFRLKEVVLFEWLSNKLNEQI